MKDRNKRKSAVKRHLNCAWLIRLKEGAYRCCDRRSPKFDKNMTQQETLEPACEYFHAKK